MHSGVLPETATAGKGPSNSKLPRRLVRPTHLSDDTHTWAPKTFTKGGVLCEHCQEHIWLGTGGFRCAVCQMAVHKKCLEFAAKTSTCGSMLKKTNSVVIPKKDLKKLKAVQLPSLREQIGFQSYVTAVQAQSFIILALKVDGDAPLQDSYYACFKGKHASKVEAATKKPPPRPSSQAPNLLPMKPSRKDVSLEHLADQFSDEWDSLRLICSYLDGPIRQQLIALKVLINLLSGHHENKRRFCTGGLVPVLVQVLVEDKSTGENAFLVPIQVFEILKECFATEAALRKYMFARKIASQVIAYLGSLCLKEERVKGQARTPQQIQIGKMKRECLLRGSSFLWDLVKDPNFRRYLESHGALEPILLAIQQDNTEYLRIYNLIDPKDFKLTGTRGNIYTSKENGCFISSGEYKGIKVAVKEQIPESLAFSSSFWRREASLMTMVQDPLTVNFFGAYPGNEEAKVMPFMIMALEENGNLWNFITQHKGISDQLLANITVQMVNSLLVLHNKKILHRDIKPQNFLLDSHCNIKLIDFGESRVLSQSALNQEAQEDPDDPFHVKYYSKTQSTFVGTIEFMAPEVYLQKPYGFQADVYSLAMVLWSCCALKMPFEDVSEVALHASVARGTAKETIPPGVHPVFQRIISEGWEHDQDKRIKLREILLVLWDMQDSAGNYLCRTYLRLNKTNGLLRLCCIADTPSLLSLALTCKHFYDQLPRPPPPPSSAVRQTHSLVSISAPPSLGRGTVPRSQTAPSLGKVLIA